MRLMLVTGSFPPMQCGVGDYTHRLAMSLAEIPGNSVALLTSAECAPDAGRSPRLEVFPVMQGWRLSEWRKALAVMRQWRPDVIHIQYPTQGYGQGRLPPLLPLMGRLSGARVVQTWHEPIQLREALGLLLTRLSPGPVVVVRPQYLDLIHPSLRKLISKPRLRFIPSASAIPRARLTSQQRDALRRQYLKGQQRLVVFFGFLYRHKGVDLLFDIANPTTDHLVIAGDTDHLDYKAELQHAAGSGAWAGKATLMGFMPAQDVAELLSIADAVVLPFRLGGGEWNTSIHGAVANGAYVVTTSLTRHGYDAQRNVFYAGVEAIDEMRDALTFAPRPHAGDAPVCGWGDISAAHMNVYRADQGSLSPSNQ
jgi:glycosyltransferase involved in cell wall biosynthesis